MISILHYIKLLIISQINVEALNIAIFRVNLRNRRSDKEKDRKHQEELKSKDAIHSRETFLLKKEHKEQREQDAAKYQIQIKTAKKLHKENEQQAKYLRKEIEKVTIIKHYLEYLQNNLVQSKHEVIRTVSKIDDVLIGKNIDDYKAELKVLISNHEPDKPKKEKDANVSLVPETLPIREVFSESK